MKVAKWALLGLILLNVAGMVAMFVLNGEVRQSTSWPKLEAGDAFPRFSGVDLNGIAWEATDAPCRVIRVSADDCQYCQQDKPLYDAMVRAAKSSSCEVVEIAPIAGAIALDARPGVVQLEFIDADIGALLFPFVTPQTIILNQGWRVQMNRRGALNEKSLQEAVRLFGDVASTPPSAAGLE